MATKIILGCAPGHCLANHKMPPVCMARLAWTGLSGSGRNGRSEIGALMILLVLRIIRRRV